MFEKILFPTELSKNDDKLIHFIVGLKKYGVKEVVLSHVSNPVGLEQPLAERLEAELLKSLNKRVAVLQKAGISVKPVILFGDPQKQILSLAEDENVSVITLGSRGKKLFEELFKGSISEVIARRSPVPVMMLRYSFVESMTVKELEKLGANLLDRILCPVDFSEGSELALNFIKQCDSKSAKSIMLLNVLDEKESRHEKSREIALKQNRRLLTGIKSELASRKFNIDYEMTVGPVLAEILDYSKHHDSSVVVIGPHGKGVTSELFVGSVSLNLVRTANLPVIMVH